MSSLWPRCSSQECYDVHRARPLAVLGALCQGSSATGGPRGPGGNGQKAARDISTQILSSPLSLSWWTPTVESAASSTAGWTSLRCGRGTWTRCASGSASELEGAPASTAYGLWIPFGSSRGRGYRGRARRREVGQYRTNTGSRRSGKRQRPTAWPMRQHISCGKTSACARWHETRY